MPLATALSSWPRDFVPQRDRHVQPCQLLAPPVHRTPSRCRPCTAAAVVSMPPSVGPRRPAAPGARARPVPWPPPDPPGRRRPPAPCSGPGPSADSRPDIEAVEFVTAPGLDYAGDDRVPVVADHARLIAQQAGADPVRLVGPQPCDQVRVGDLSPGHLDQVGGPVGQRRLRRSRVHHAALQDHRDRPPTHLPSPLHRRPDLTAELNAEARLGVQVGPGRRTE